MVGYYIQCPINDARSFPQANHDLTPPTMNQLLAIMTMNHHVDGAIVYTLSPFDVFIPVFSAVLQTTFLTQLLIPNTSVATPW